MSPPVSILIVGAHPGHGRSMRRYSELLRDGWSAVPGVRVTLATPSAHMSGRLSDARARKFLRYIEQLVFMMRLARLHRRFDAVHVADHSDAVYVPALRRRKVIVTCHDLFAVRAARGGIPEHRSRLTGRLYQQLVVWGLKRATLIVAVSEATKSELEAEGFLTRVMVIDNPLDPRMATTQEPTRGPIAEPYLLVVGNPNWRRARGDAIRVWMTLRDQGELGDLALVLVGPNLTPEEQNLVGTAAIATRALQGVDDEQLRSLYAGATATVILSKYEGFGWPAVESQVQGTPVIARDIPILRSTVGRAGVFVKSGHDLARQLKGVRDRLDVASQHCQENADRFTMDRFVLALRGVLAQLQP